MRVVDGFGRAMSWAIGGGLAMAGRRNPWGKPPRGGEGQDEGKSDEPEAEAPGEDKPGKGAKGPRNPWLPPGQDKTGPRRSANIEDIFRQRGPEGPRRAGGPGGPSFRLPPRPGGKSWWPIIIGAIVAVWLFFTSVHFIQPREQGIVTTFGKYSRTINSGTNFTWPWPFQSVDVENVSEIRDETFPEGSAEKLILTGDQNLVDLSYVVRWNIKNLAQFRYQLAEPVQALRDIAEAAMRASVAELELDRVLSGAGRAQIEARVHARMQEILDAYGAGIAIQGVGIVKTEPPERVVEAFKDVSAAQQDADAAVNRARAYAQRVLARAQGDAEAFNQIYAEYRLAPEVTRKRLYYETMESVLGKTDKTIIEADGVVPYLPLPAVNRGSRSRTVTPAPGTGGN